MLRDNWWYLRSSESYGWFTIPTTKFRTSVQSELHYKVSCLCAQSSCQRRNSFTMRSASATWSHGDYTRLTLNLHI